MVENITNIKLNIISLYKSNYLCSYHIREMAKLLKKSHVTLLPHINTLEKDKILSLKQTGKNKICTLNIDSNVAKSFLLLAETHQTINISNKIFLIKKIIEGIFNLGLDGSIILFGSYAKQTFNNSSDIDLFYLGNISDKEVQEIKNIGKQYGKIINIKKSTVNYFYDGLRKKDPLVIEIIKNHILLQNGELFINLLWRYYNEIRI